jgi:hypothetical protein
MSVSDMKRHVAKFRVLYTEEKKSCVTDWDKRQLYHKCKASMARFICHALNIHNITPIVSPRVECVFWLNEHMAMDTVRLVFLYLLKDSRKYPEVGSFALRPRSVNAIAAADPQSPPRKTTKRKRVKQKARQSMHSSDSGPPVRKRKLTVIAAIEDELFGAWRPV